MDCRPESVLNDLSIFENAKEGIKFLGFSVSWRRRSRHWWGYAHVEHEDMTCEGEVFYLTLQAPLWFISCMNLAGTDCGKSETTLSSGAREPWDCPQLIPLDLSAARGFFCSKISDKAKDIGPMKCS